MTNVAGLIERIGKILPKINEYIDQTLLKNGVSIKDYEDFVNKSDP